ncbi:MAG TPA: DNA primase, partial [Thermoanaerobaculia bacterium]
TIVTAPSRPDFSEGIDEAVGSLDSILALSAAHEAAGQGDAPWPPNYKKQAGEPKRVQPSKARREKHPLIVVAKADRKEEALAQLEEWKAQHPAVAAKLAVDDILVDSMRGRSSTWTRIRVNLRHVPEDERPV